MSAKYLIGEARQTIPWQTTRIRTIGGGHFLRPFFLQCICRSHSRYARGTHPPAPCSFAVLSASCCFPQGWNTDSQWNMVSYAAPQKNRLNWSVFGSVRYRGARASGSNPVTYGTIQQVRTTFFPRLLTCWRALYVSFWGKKRFLSTLEVVHPINNPTA